METYSTSKGLFATLNSISDLMFSYCLFRAAMRLRAIDFEAIRFCLSEFELLTRAGEHFTLC